MRSVHSRTSPSMTERFGRWHDRLRLFRPFALAVAWLAQCITSAGTGPHDELDVKAAMIYNFTKFVEWPEGAFENARAPFVIAYIGDESIGKRLVTAVKGKQFGSRAYIIRRVAPRGLDFRFHVLVVADKPAMTISQLSICRDKPILMIGDTESFAKGGGHVGFVEDGRRIAFVINNRSAQASGLTISSKLLVLAKKVDP